MEIFNSSFDRAGPTVMPEAVAITEAELLALATENVELRHHLAEAQEQCIELAVDAGELHATIEALREQLAITRAERDAWEAEAKRSSAKRATA